MIWNVEAKVGCFKFGLFFIIHIMSFATMVVAKGASGSSGCHFFVVGGVKLNLIKRTSSSGAVIT